MRNPSPNLVKKITSQGTYEIRRRGVEPLPLATHVAYGRQA